MEPRLDSTCSPPPPRCWGDRCAPLYLAPSLFLKVDYSSYVPWRLDWVDCIPELVFIVFLFSPLFSLHWLACGGSASSMVLPTWWWAAVIASASAKILNLFICNTRSTRLQRVQNGHFSSIFCVSVGQCLFLLTCVITSILSTWHKLGSSGKKGAHLRKRLHETD